MGPSKRQQNMYFGDEAMEGKESAPLHSGGKIRKEQMQKDTVISLRWKLKWYQKKVVQQIEQTHEVSIALHVNVCSFCRFVGQWSALSDCVL